jgi:hypothetical protein
MKTPLLLSKAVFDHLPSHNHDGKTIADILISTYLI